ncbi:hypothetical protein Pan14r_00550 [Crateriforma conspicua]|uniref:Uncharacterized protein n=1 Tax=Crateriforma conspicua TaxID=2527996 RepID=A0A5C5XYN5_9PLAN|nr:hypothetical protein Mal65_25530 [Crateriforma conspicua]TWT67818.1 hypothetical protein Pan14r_00550 [Crateriforma conspicua]
MGEPHGASRGWGCFATTARRYLDWLRNERRDFRCGRYFRGAKGDFALAAGGDVSPPQPDAIVIG